MTTQNLEQSEALASAIKKAAIRLLPFLALMYALSFVDRANVGFAKIAYQADTGIGNAAYAFGAGVFFVGYAIFEVPSNLILHKIGAKIWMSRIMVTWGIVSASMIFATTETSFYTIRFLLGASEAGFFPGVILFMTYWFPAKQRARALGLFYFGVPLAMLFGSPLSGYLLDMHSMFGLTNWQWMFTVEGLSASIVGVIAFFYLDSRPRNAKWLTPEEKTALITVVEAEDAAKQHTAPNSVFGVLKSGRVLMFIIIYFCIQIGNAPLAFYLPSKLASTMGGQVNFTVGLLLSIPWLCTIIAMRVATKFADSHDNHRLVATSMLAAGIIAFASLSVITTPVLTLIAFCIAIPGLVACQPVFWSLPTRYLGGTGAASGIAFIVAIGNLGGFVSPQIKAYADNLAGNTNTGFLVVAILCFMSVLLLCTLRSQPTVPPLAPDAKPAE
ncbi:MFS transporter [Telmatospirillum sp.]|uniref:MFS transporter n=1 Tax=Telmatospirillum sp. TaxID=2079197 RepID=UPI0028471A2D|nr:MFS transporter [Telmatospirillum sp.]MDR3439220.1 MFS transporter [Telmatospirillum sp.]